MILKKLLLKDSYRNDVAAQVYPEVGPKARRTWHTDNSLFGKAGDDMEKIALFSP